MVGSAPESTNFSFFKESLFYMIHNSVFNMLLLIQCFSPKRISCKHSMIHVLRSNSEGQVAHGIVLRAGGFRCGKQMLTTQICNAKLAECYREANSYHPGENII